MDRILDERQVTPVSATSSARELVAAVRARQVSSRELLETYLDRIERLDDTVNAVVTIDAEQARRAADDADDALARGEPTGPLHGLPITVKDAIATAGIRSTGGAVELAGYVPTSDAPAVARLKAAGAIVFGKTNVPRWSIGLQTYNEMFGVTSNPWSADRVPGGSSGGGAAATACGFTSFEIGTDVGGSIRIPAHFCGVFGLKPSFGVVPQRGCLYHVGGGMTDMDLNTLGPLCRSPDDLDLVLSVLAGPGPELQHAWSVELPPLRGHLPGDYRVGVWFDDDACPVDSAYRDLMSSVAEVLADAGARVEESHPAIHLAEQVDLFDRLVGPAMAPSFDDATANELAGSHLDWLRCDALRATAQRAWADWFESYDLLLCPVTLGPAFVHMPDLDLFADTVTLDGTSRPFADYFAWAGMVNALGLPAATAPIGRTPGGLPVGVQVIAPYLRDRDAVKGTELITSLIGGYEVPPGF